MARLVQILGIPQIRKNLRARQARTMLRTAAGIKAVGLFLQRESQRLVPVDTGNLKASAFTRASGTGPNFNVTVGYTAAYALFVHEAVEMKLKGKPRTTRGRYWDPQGRGQAKFLEEPSRTKRAEMLAIMRKFVTIKGP